MIEYIYEEKSISKSSFFYDHSLTLLLCIICIFINDTCIYEFRVHMILLHLLFFQYQNFVINALQRFYIYDTESFFKFTHPRYSDVLMISVYAFIIH